MHFSRLHDVSSSRSRVPTGERIHSIRHVYDIEFVLYLLLHGELGNIHHVLIELVVVIAQHLYMVLIVYDLRGGPLFSLLLLLFLGFLGELTLVLIQEELRSELSFIDI